MSVKLLKNKNKRESSQQKTFEKLYSEHWEALYSRAFSVLTNTTLATDIVQDVWVDFWERRDEIENINIEGYLFNSLRFRIFKEFRKQKYENKLVQDFILLANEYNITDEDIDYNETLDRLYEVIDSFPCRCKEIFLMSRFKGLKNKEIAEKLGISQRTVETHISKALKILRHHITPSIALFFIIGF